MFAIQFILKSRKFWKLCFDLLAAERDLQLGDATAAEAQARAIAAIQEWFSGKELS